MTASTPDDATDKATSNTDQTSARDKIVAAARRAFYEQGFEDTSFADLAKASGVPKGNFYYHFKSKAELLAVVLDARTSHIEESLRAWDQTLPTPTARLFRFVQMLTAEREDLVRYGCPMGSLLTELGKKRQSELHEQARQQLDIYMAWVAAQFEALEHPRIAARELATRLLSRCQGAVLIAHAYQDAGMLQREVSDIESWIASITAAT